MIQPDGNVTTTSDGNSSYSRHSGSVNFELRRLKNGRRAAICQLDGNESVEDSDQDSVSDYSSDDEVESQQ